MPFFKHLDEHSDITFNDRKRLGPLDKVSQRIMRRTLSTAEKETIAAFVSGLNACQFCYGSHAAVAAHFGIEADIIRRY